MGLYFIIGYIGVILAAIAQIILKYGALRNVKSNRIHFFLNSYTIAGYFIMFVVTLLNLYILRYLDLKYVLIFLPSTYLFVLLFSWIILKEKFSKKNIISYVLILGGIIVFNM